MGRVGIQISTQRDNLGIFLDKHDAAPVDGISRSLVCVGENGMDSPAFLS